MPFSFWLYYIKGCFCSKPSLSLSAQLCDQVSVTVCVVRANQGSLRKTKLFLSQEIACVCTLAHLCTVEGLYFCFCSYVDVAVWVCFFVLDIWQISRQLSTLRDKGVLLQWLHSADRKSADGHCGWVCCWKSVFECMFLYLCVYWQQWGQISNTFWSCVSDVGDWSIL